MCGDGRTIGSMWAYGWSMTLQCLKLPFPFQGTDRSGKGRMLAFTLMVLHALEQLGYILANKRSGPLGIFAPPRPAPPKIKTGWGGAELGKKS
jgi:hypothetical protein